jgi:TRAP-type mannitol/chloroaromatic compound transport system substrate-binding protein
MAMSGNRRAFLKKGIAVSAAGTLAAPMIARAESSKTFNWRMTTAYPAGLPFYQVGPGSAESFAEKCATLSGGRLKIKVFAAGELLPAFGGFDACSAGNIEMNHGNSYYWSGKTFAAQYFTTAPFGMEYLGHFSWLYNGGGLELWREVYKPFHLVPFPANSTGVQMTGWFHKPLHTLDDLKGLKMREVGLAAKIYAELGVAVSSLPGGEIFPALERGVIDAAEWVGPFLDKRLGLQNAAKYYYTTGWHEPATTGEVIVNETAWNSLPKDLQSVIQQAAAATSIEGIMYLESQNMAALDDLVKNYGVKTAPLPEAIIKGLKTATFDTLATLVAKDPVAKKVHDSYFNYKKTHDKWSAIGETQYLTRVQPL